MGTHPAKSGHYITMTCCDRSGMVTTPLWWHTDKGLVDSLVELLSKRFAEDAKACTGFTSLLCFQAVDSESLGIETVLYDERIESISRELLRSLRQQAFFGDFDGIEWDRDGPENRPEDFPALEPCRYLVAIEDFKHRLQPPDPIPSEFDDPASAKTVQPQAVPAGNVDMWGAARMIPSGYPVAWQQMHAALVGLSYMLGFRDENSMAFTIAIRDVARQVFTGSITEHLPAGALDGGGPLTMLTTQNALAVPALLESIERIRRKDFDAAEVRELARKADDLADWIAGVLRPCFASAWADVSIAQIHDQCEAFRPAPTIGDRVETRKKADQPPAAGSQAIEENDLALLAFLNRSPTMRRKVTDVLPDTGPQDRKSIGKRLRMLADRNPPLVDYPKHGRKGVAILAAGIEALKSAPAPMPR